jgi:hypothetical protein
LVPPEITATPTAQGETMKTLSKLAAGVVMAAAGAAAAVLPALPAAASSGCDFTMVSLEARNLRNDGGTDYAWVKLDRTWFPAGNNGIAFNLGDTHNALSFGNPYMGFGSGGLEVKVVLDTWPTNYTVQTKTIACSPVTNRVTTFSSGDAIYDMTYTVT